MRTLYEFAGGDAAFLALARAHHARCLADPVLNHPFSRDDQNPQHVERLAAYWAEVMGGPAAYSQSCGDESGVLQLHAGNGDMSDLGERFLACFLRALDDAALPDDPAFRAALGHTCGGPSTTCCRTRARTPSSPRVRRCRAGAGTACRSSSAPAWA